MRPLAKIAIVAGVQFGVLLAILGFKAYTTLDTQTVVLMTRVDEPSVLVSDDGSDVRRVTYDISYIEHSGTIWDNDAYGTVYVEVAEADDGVWTAVGVHGGREHTRDGSAIIRGEESYAYSRPGQTPTEPTLRFGIEDVFIPASAAGDVPDGDDHIVAVEVEVDRFGNPTPKRFLIDGEPFPLARR